MGATFVAIINPVWNEISRLVELYSWIPFMTPIRFTHDKIVFVSDFATSPASSFTSYGPIVTTDGLSLPLRVKLEAPKANDELYLTDVLPLFWNGNGDCLGVLIRRGKGRLILLPRFRSNSEVIETFLHRVVPKLYTSQSKAGLIESYSSPTERTAHEELEELRGVERQVLERQELVRRKLIAALGEKEKVVKGDATAKQVLIYYDHARRQDDVALFYLYKIVEAIENKFGGESVGIATVGAGVPWKAVKRLANETYRDGRHAPKPGDNVRKWSASEIKKCFEDTETVVIAYFETLFSIPSVTVSDVQTELKDGQ